MSDTQLKNAITFFLDGFEEEIHKACESTLFGDPMAMLCRKLKLVKENLIALNKAHPSISLAVQQARELLQHTQNDLTADPLKQNLFLLEQTTILKLNKVSEEEESLLK